MKHTEELVTVADALGIDLKTADGKKRTAAVLQVVVASRKLHAFAMDVDDALFAEAMIDLEKATKVIGARLVLLSQSPTRRNP